jgi:hypothetical protein
MNDPVNPDLRKIEKEIDEFYLTNPLMKKDYAYATWLLSVVSEDSFFLPLHGLKMKGEELSSQDLAVISDNFVNNLNYPLRWLWSSCKLNGKINFVVDNDDYKAAKTLLELGQDYLPFVAVYTYATLGLVNLELKGREITPEKEIHSIWEYEAYNRLVRTPIDYLSLNYEKFPKDSILQTLGVYKKRFSYKVNPRIIEEAIEVLQPLIQPRFTLPENWKFSQFTLGEFKKIYESLFVLSYIRFFTRIAVANSCYAFGLLR